MATTEVNPKSERKKMIAAIVLGLGALLTLWYAFFGSTPTRSTTTTTTTTTTKGTNNGSIAPRSPATTADGSGALTPVGLRDEGSQTPPSPIPLGDVSPPAVPEASRNIFAFYVKPEPPPKPEITPPPPTPTPPPPLTVASVSPANVYARTGDFKLEVAGDKFTQQTRVYIDGRELETRFVNAQQLSATVPSAVIAYEGARQIIVRNADGTIYSNTATLNVAAPPMPNYTYVGLVGGSRFNDTAILKDKGNKNLMNVTRGDLVGGRFRVTSISQREVVLVDTTLRIKHTLPLTPEGSNPGSQPRPQQPVLDGAEGEGEPEE